MNLIEVCTVLVVVLDNAVCYPRLHERSLVVLVVMAMLARHNKRVVIRRAHGG